MGKKTYPKLKVYTKTGDKGETSLFGGKRVPKFHLRVEAYGTVDELNSAIGFAIAQTQNAKRKTQTLPAGRQDYSSKLKTELTKIQNDLLDIGSTLANPKSNYELRITNYLKQRTAEMERLIDTLTVQIPELKQFILPGGGKSGAQLHLCRTIARRAERRIVELSRKERIDSSILEYFNRLSDLLFTMARFVNFKEKKKEAIWKKR